MINLGENAMKNILLYLPPYWVSAKQSTLADIEAALYLVPNIYITIWVKIYSYWMKAISKN